MHTGSHYSSSPLFASPSHALKGDLYPPGDKSISHRAVMLGMLSIGTTEIEGLLESEDVLSTIACCQALGAHIEKKHVHWRVTGVGIGGLSTPEDVLNFGNAGTACRLMMGILASHPVQCFLTGDSSLRSRPMLRVMTPLSQIGARFHSTENRLPMMLTGASRPMAIEYTPILASAQVKSAIMLAGLNCAGITTVIEQTPTRNHTETMLELFGCKVKIEEDRGRSKISLNGFTELQPTKLSVPSDISSAAFALVAACVTPGSEITIHNVMNNPTRDGILVSLIEMGAQISTETGAPQSGEDTIHIHARYAPLKAITVPSDRVPSMVDEFPVLAVAAACAEGTTRFQNIAELRVKESDRLEETAKMLRLAGIHVETGDDWMEITGQPTRKGGGMMPTGGDHRIAMSTLILGGVTDQGMGISDSSAILTSYPNFSAQMQALGCVISTEDNT